MAEIARRRRGVCVTAHASGVGAFGPLPADVAPPAAIFPLDSARLKKVLSVSARELCGAADEPGRQSPRLSLRARLRDGDGVVGFLGVVGGACAASPARVYSKELNRSRAGCWVLGHFRQRGIGRCVGPSKVEKSGTVWRGLAALPPSSCCDKLDGTPLQSLEVWHFRPDGIGGRAARSQCIRGTDATLREAVQ